MRVVGLTGSIACGKSLVSSWLAGQPGCRVIDGDLLSRELTAPEGIALAPIRRQFGDTVFHADGTLNRRALGEIVFTYPEARLALDNLMAPLLQDLTCQRIAHAEEEGVLLCFLDFPLLFEKGYDRLCSSVWCVVLPRDIQLQRLMQRDSLTEDEALKRMEAVLSSEEKASRSQVIIDNSGDMAFTLSLLPPLLAAEEEKAREAQPARRRRRSRDVSEDPGVSPSSLSDAASSVPARPLSAVSGGPTVMERPSSARRKSKKRFVRWAVPFLLVLLLSVTLFLLLASVTSQALMRAYLTRQAEKHLAEDRAIHASYPLFYAQLIGESASEFNLNPAFVTAIILKESSFQPMAESRVGARGLMQLMPDTAEWIAGKMKVSGYSFDRMYDPQSNVRFGCWYLRFLAGLFQGDPVCVSCAYHAGQGQVTAWLSDRRFSDDGKHLNLSSLPEGPTKSYAAEVIKAYGIYQALYSPDSWSDAGSIASSVGSDGR